MSKINYFKARVEMELKRRGLTTSDLARCMDAAPQNIVVTLNTGNPTIKTMRRFADALGISPETFMRPVTESEYKKIMTETPELPTFE